jgi:hypothetical protein
VRAGDVADGVDQRHDQHAPHNGDGRERGHAVLLVHHDHAAAGEDQEERRQELGDELRAFTYVTNRNLIWCWYTSDAYVCWTS